MLDLQRAAYDLREVTNQFLDQVGHFFEIGIRPIGLEHGELGIVLSRDAFIAEVPVDLENFVETADK